MEKLVRLGLVNQLQMGYHLKIYLKENKINIIVFNKNNAIITSKESEPKLIDNKLDFFGEFIKWENLNNGYIYKIVKNPLSNINCIFYATLHDKVMDKQLVANSILKAYERKYL